MKLAIASGKGGTGKTTLSVALALSASEPVQYLDCDVEAPNGNLFLNPSQTTREDVSVLVPVVNQSRCNGCGKCAELCQFSAIIANKKQRSATTFPELCHSCGGCELICPTGAITEKQRVIGQLQTGQAQHIEYVQGRLNIGEAMAPPIIEAVKEKIRPGKLTILDAPPGTSCPMITTVRDADFVILVTEPTPFGLYDLSLAVETMRQLKRPFGVVINRAGSGDDRVESYCQQQDIEVLLRIPDARVAAQHYSKGVPITETFPGLKTQLVNLLQQLKAEEPA